MPRPLPLIRVGEPLQPDALELAGERMATEPGLELPEVAAPLADASLGCGGRRDDEIGALQTDRVLARAEESPSTIRPSRMYGVPRSCRSPKNRRSL